MQINPFGFPLGAGVQSAPAFGGTGLGFIDALGVAIEGGAPQVRTGLIASATPPAHFDAKLAQTLLAQAQLDTQANPAAVTLPGLQQPTSLSQLMTTAAKLPTAEATPLAPAASDTPVAEPAGMLIEAPEVPVQPETPITSQARVQPAMAKPSPQASALPISAETQPDETLVAGNPVIAKPTGSSRRRPSPRR
jgi:flagellar hook-length control protein FliK